MADKLSVMPDTDYIDACNAIREKDGSTGPIKSGEMGAKIRAIPSGGGGGESSKLDVVIDRSVKKIRSDTVTSIGEHAFNACSHLTIAEFPAVKKIGPSAFTKCAKLETVKFPIATSLSGYAFQGCRYLKNVDFSMLETIDNAAFSGCAALQTVKFPRVTSINLWVFGECSALTSVELPSITYIADSAFRSTPNMAELRIATPTVCKLGGDLKIPGTCKIYVPASLIEQYKVATNWSKYATQFVAIEGV